ncbi:MAG: hypothetical protein ABRQ25_09320 [Clostridiaceae bacterium]
MKCDVVVIVTNTVCSPYIKIQSYSTSDTSLDALIDVNSAGITISTLYSSGFTLTCCTGDVAVQYTFVRC